MSKLFLVLALLLGATAGGCADRPLPTDPFGPAYDFTNHLDTGNPMVDRWMGLGWFTYEAEETGLFAVVATSNIEMGCHRPYQIFTRHHVQDILHELTPVEGAKINRLWRTTGAFITVYEGNPQTCAELAAAKLAEGFGNFIMTDNDVNAPWNDSPNRNAFGSVAQGQLQLVNGGGTAHFSLVQKCVWDGADWAASKCHTKIDLK